MGNLLELQNIETYYGPIMAIRGVSMDVPEGKVVSVLGANGAGKTTVLKTISGAMDPQKGTVTFKGERIDARDPDWVARRGIAHVPEGREVFPFLSVEDNLRMGAFSRRDSEVSQDIELVYEYFPVLKEYRGNQAEYLSGGQQQMLAIGRALMSRPETVLLDEPSMGLAPQLVEQIFEIVKSINEKEGVSFLLAEQNTNVALRYAHYGYILESGRVVMDGEAKALRENQDVKEFYLGMSDQGRKSFREVRSYRRRKRWLS